MATIAVAVRPRSLDLPTLGVAVPPHPRVSPGRIASWFIRLTYWPAELVRLVALIYMLPIVIYAVAIPAALLFNALFVLLGGSWKAFWH